MEAYKVIKYPLSTEKSMRMMESENKLVFVIDKDASKKDVKEAVEKMFKAKVDKVNTYLDSKGKKKAYVKFNIETPAIDVATELGMM